MKRNELPKQIFVTGTDTEIGKTLVSSMLVAGLQAHYWKPVQSGLAGETDTEVVKRLSKVPDAYFHPEAYRLTEPLSPHASAAIDEVEIAMDRFRLPDLESDQHLIVEGAGGLMVPLNDEEMIIDLIVQLDLPVILVSRSTLGTLNHTFLSLAEMRRRGITVLGVMMSGPKNESNRLAIENYGEIEVIGEVPLLEEVTHETLITQFDRIFT